MSADSQYTSSTFPATVRRKLGTSSSCTEPYRAVRIWAVEWKGAWPSSGMRTTRTEPSMAGDGGAGDGGGGGAGTAVKRQWTYRSFPVAVPVPSPVA
eukprot:scaffold44020_cov57-Phaeocystis_antarctica.AAC.1